MWRQDSLTQMRAGGHAAAKRRRAAKPAQPISHPPPPVFLTWPLPMRKVRGLSGRRGSTMRISSALSWLTSCTTERGVGRAAGTHRGQARHQLMPEVLHMGLNAASSALYLGCIAQCWTIPAVHWPATQHQVLSRQLACHLPGGGAALRGCQASCSPWAAARSRAACLHAYPGDSATRQQAAYLYQEQHTNWPVGSKCMQRRLSPTAVQP